MQYGREFQIAVEQFPLASKEVLDTAIIGDEVLNHAIKVYIETETSDMEVYEYRGNIAITSAGYFIARYRDIEKWIQERLDVNNRHMEQTIWLSYRLQRQTIFAVALLMVGNFCAMLGMDIMKLSSLGIVFMVLAFTIYIVLILFVIFRKQIAKRWRI